MSELLFDFLVDKEKKIITIIREFAVESDLLWDTFTRPELLDQWVAPKPWTARTKYMDFKVGGQRFYAMVSPEGEERWAIQKYTSITPKTNFKIFNVFADENENPEPHGSEWDFTFSQQDAISTVKITIYNESFERMDSLLEGFKIGFAMSIENLENLLLTLKGDRV